MNANSYRGCTYRITANSFRTSASDDDKAKRGTVSRLVSLFLNLVQYDAHKRSVPLFDSTCEANSLRAKQTYIPGRSVKGESDLIRSVSRETVEANAGKSCEARLVRLDETTIAGDGACELSANTPVKNRKRAWRSLYFVALCVFLSA